jgi:hypothetical protein
LGSLDDDDDDDDDDDCLGGVCSLAISLVQSTAMSALAVPVVDLSQARPDDEIARDIDAACRSVGFLQVINHGTIARTT